MKVRKPHLILFIIFLLALSVNKIHACSMYKITADGKTMVGCNHDTWYTTPKIWFENGNNPNEWGAGFTGARPIGGNRTAPQSGMNEKGLTFSKLYAYYPKQKNPFSNKLTIENEDDYVTDILHRCATVKDVKKYIEEYDHSIFIDHVFIYIDSLGNYLIVEPYNFIEGNDASYVLSNFCPSITSNEQARQIKRYRNGEDFLKTQKANTSLAYCSALSDTMHVCRNKNGDGTLLTSIWDTKERVVNLYFYHHFDASVQFNLTEELAKGDHTIDVPNLFPGNAEFERLKNYKTPFNTPLLRILLVLGGGLLCLMILLFILALVIAKNKEINTKNVFLISTLNLFLTGYLFVLATHENVYYFDTPYKHYGSQLISISSYTPFLLLIAMFPISVFTIKRLKSTYMKGWIKATVVFNYMLYLSLILSFCYWGLYSIWN